MWCGQISWWALEMRAEVSEDIYWLVSPWFAVHLERWYGFPSGCQRCFSDWAGFWIAFENGRRSVCVLIGRLWYGLYGYTMCTMGLVMDLQGRYRFTHDH